MVGDDPSKTDQRYTENIIGDVKNLNRTVFYRHFIDILRNTRTENIENTISDAKVYF